MTLWEAKIDLSMNPMYILRHDGYKIDYCLTSSYVRRDHSIQHPVNSCNSNAIIKRTLIFNGAFSKNVYGIAFTISWYKFWTPPPTRPRKKITPTTMSKMIKAYSIKPWAVCNFCVNLFQNNLTVIEFFINISTCPCKLLNLIIYGFQF